MSLHPNSSEFIDIHTHNTEMQQGVFSLRNVFLSDYPQLPTGKPLTIGLHPWHINPESLNMSRTILKIAASLPEVVAIGETGLDKIIRTSPFLQEELFKVHIEVSIELKKPLIIHCVKAFQEIIRLMKETKPLVPWIIHGYHGSGELTAELIRHGFYLSLNEWILKTPEKTRGFLSHIPPDRLFTETDEYPDHIAGLYDFLSEYYNRDIKQDIFHNYKSVFGIHELQKDPMSSTMPDPA